MLHTTANAINTNDSLQTVLAKQQQHSVKTSHLLKMCLKTTVTLLVCANMKQPVSTSDW